MKTKVINGVECKMIIGNELVRKGDWFVGAYGTAGEYTEPASGVIGERADWICTHTSSRVFREIKKRTKAKATGIEAKVCADIAERQRKGIAKYGTTVADNDLTDLQWARHLYEELLDASVYMRKIIANMEAKGK